MTKVSQSTLLSDVAGDEMIPLYKPGQLSTDKYHIRTDYLGFGMVMAQAQGLVPGTVCSDELQTIIDNNVGKLVVIGRDTDDIFYLNKPITVPSYSKIEILGTVKMIDFTERALTSNTANGSNTVAFDNSDGTIVAGMRIVLSDDNQPVNGGGAWKTRKVGNTNVVVSANATGCTCQYNFSGITGAAYQTSQNAKIGLANSSFLIDGVSNVSITGTGIIDGNRANNYNIAGSRYDRTIEDLRSACGISLNNCSDIYIGRGLTIKDQVLHCIATSAGEGYITNRCTIEDVLFDGPVDKAIAGLDLWNSLINKFRNINGVDEGEVILYNGCRNTVISNGLSYNNRRYGIAITGQDNSQITVSNCQSITGRNKATTYNFYFQNQFYGLQLSNLTSTAEEMQSTWTRSTTTATITTPVAHNLTTGDVIYVTVTLSSAAIPTGTYTVTVTNSTTFTITCLNAGLTSGTLSYCGVATDGVMVFNSCKNVDAKNVSIYQHPVATVGLSVGANTAFSSTSENIRFDGLNIINSLRKTSTRTLSFTNALKCVVENYTIDGVNRVLNDAPGNDYVRFKKGYVANYTTLFETDNSKFIFEDTFGIVTENASTATIPSGSTSVIINHLLTRTPLAQNFTITPTKLGNSAKWWISDITANTFKLNVDADPGSDTATFQWRIKSYMGDVTTEPAYTLNYQSDFSAGDDGWTGNNMVVSGNNDGISDGTTSKDNVLKAYCNATNGTHEISKAVCFVGKLNRVTIEYYIPSAQTNVNDLRAYANAFGTTIVDVAEVSPGLWRYVTTAYFTPTSTTMYIRAMKTFTTSFAGANSASDDIIYISSVRVEYLP